MGIESLKGLFLDEENVLDMELKEPKLDRLLSRRFSTRNRGSVRMSLGLFYTKEEWEQRRKELVARPLP